jgi:hypothetical protein
MALSLPVKKLYVLWACILLCLLPFVILSFFNFITYDDYGSVILFNKYGFLKTQQFIYLNWEGRFTATFLCAICEKAGILTHSYFLVFFLFAFFTWIAVFFFLNSINRYVLSRIFSRVSLIPASLVLFVMDMYVMTETSSGVYWFSAAAVYQTAFILFLILTGCLVRRFTGFNGAGLIRKPWQDIIIVFLCILLCGTNEVAMVASVCFFLLLMAAYRYYGLAVPRPLFVYLGVVLLTGVIILLTSGIWSMRRLMMGQTGYGSVIMIILFRVAIVFYYVLKEPLFWACAAACFMLGMRVSVTPAAAKLSHALSNKRYFIPGLTGIALLVLCTLAPVLWVTHGSIPYRALNDLTSLVAFGLLAMFFLSGAGSQSLAPIILPVKHLSALAIVLICFGLLVCNIYKESWKNVITGYFYHAIQTDRRKIFTEAREHHERVATIKPYDAALNEKLQQVFPKGAPATLKRLLEERPTLLYFDKGAENRSPLQAFLLGYYQLDSIVVQPHP